MKTLIIIGLLGTMSFAQISAQTTEVLSGTLSTSKTLNASTCYELNGCYSVAAGGVLNIPAGTQILANSQASVIVHQGGQIFANGTSTNPVVFTSSKSTTARAPGDWNGIFIAGYAVNNQGVQSQTISCAGSVTYGGTNNADNSGSMQYVRIEYAGVGDTGDPEGSGLNLWAVGSGTTLDHIQVSYSRKNGYSLLGGKVALNNLISLNNYKADLIMTEGYTGNVQFLTSIRLDPNAHDNATIFSNGIVVSNDASGSASTPVSHPIMSNLSFIGPHYCGASPVHSDFRAAVRLGLNAQAEIYNSVFTGWNTGLAIFDNSTINNANVNGTILASYNTFYANATNYTNSPVNFDPTGTGCAATITDWMDGSVFCSQINNVALSTPLTGYSNTLCGNYCSAAPVLTLSATNNVGAADFSWDTPSNFSHVSNRGSITATDWSATWKNVCPKETEYCSLSALEDRGTPNKLGMQPNPAGVSTTVSFHAVIKGVAKVTVSDKVTGRMLKVKDYQVDRPGIHQLNLRVDDLQEGLYIVTVTQPDGTVLSGQLVVL